MWRIIIRIVMIGTEQIYVHGFKGDKLGAEGKARHYGNNASPAGSGTKVISSEWIETIAPEPRSAFGEIEE
jgi:hypothetical protein